MKSKEIMIKKIKDKWFQKGIKGAWGGAWYRNKYFPLSKSFPSVF